MLVTPFARAPPLIDRMSARTQSASLIFWQIVTSPIVRTQFASAATANGTARVACHDQPCAANPGGPACSWNPVLRRNGPQPSDVDYLGVWVLVDHPFVTGLFGQTLTIQRAAVVRLEPGIFE